MDVYTMNANDLSIYIKAKEKLTKSKIPKIIKYSENLTIDHKYTSILSFNETLAVLNDKEEEVGEFIGKIRTCNSNTTSESMMINMRSRSISDHGEERGMTVVTKTTANFHSYEEKWTQWCSKKSEMESKTVLISKINYDGPIQIYTDVNNGELIDQTHNINTKYINGLCTEGMNYAFLRYIAIKGFEGIIKKKASSTINGVLCKTIYECSLKNYEVNKYHIPVVIVKRIIYVGKMKKHPTIEMTTVLTRAGYILKHSWGKKINKELMIRKNMHITKSGRVFTNKRLYLKTHWDQDARLKAIYLDKVSEMKMKYKNYIKTNVAVKHMVIDYVTAILLAKPDDVMKFSTEYFTEFK